jgi:hypothetical protein
MAARRQAVSYLADEELLRRAFDAEPEIVEAAVARSLQLTSQPGDRRNATVRRILGEPVLASHYDGLDVDYRVWNEEKRYVKDVDKGDVPPPKGMVLVENVSLTISDGPTVLFKKAYKGNKARRTEAFAPGTPVKDGYHVKFNAAEIDYVEMCTSLLAPLGPEALKAAGDSRNKYVREAAAVLADTWLKVSTKIEREGEEDDDD